MVHYEYYGILWGILLLQTRDIYSSEITLGLTRGVEKWNF